MQVEHYASIVDVYQWRLHEPSFLFFSCFLTLPNLTQPNPTTPYLTVPHRTAPNRTEPYYLPILVDMIPVPRATANTTNMRAGLGSFRQIVITAPVTIITANVLPTSTGWLPIQFIIESK